MLFVTAAAIIGSLSFYSFRTPKPEVLYKGIMHTKEAYPETYKEILKINYSVVAHENNHKTTLNPSILNEPFLANYKSNRLSKKKERMIRDAKTLYVQSYRASEYHQNLNYFKQMLIKDLINKEEQRLCERAQHSLEIEKLVDQDVLSAYCTPRQEQINKEKAIHNQMEQAKAKDSKADLTGYTKQLCDLYETNAKDELETKLRHIKNNIKQKLNKMDLKEKNKDHIINRYTNTLRIFPNSDERKKHFNANLESYQKLQESVQK